MKHFDGMNSSDAPRGAVMRAVPFDDELLIDLPT
jgi:hypothetical protein